MGQSSVRWAVLSLLLASVSFNGVAKAATCQNTGSFERWLEGFKKDALAAGISQRTLASASPGMTFDQGIINKDRGQSIFSQSFLEFSGRMVGGDRIPSGRRQMQRHAPIFAKIQQQYGVPASVIVAFWALESDFGTNMGRDPVLKSLTTLAYDCRRGDMFRNELLEALKIVERGDLRPAEMIGSWAGELGQTQFLPSFYNKYAIDYEGKGRRDLLRNSSDVIASTANFLQGLGWRKGEPWIEEVRVPASMDWAQADLGIKHPKTQWAKWGVTRTDGRPLAGEPLPASLLLPMGRNGPAFLAYSNFDVYRQWNQSLVYALTAGYLATRLDGAAQVQRGNGPVTPLNFGQIKDLQALLVRNGFANFEIDGKLGYETRKAVRAAQLKLGMPADGYPQADLLDRLHGFSAAAGASRARVRK